MSAIDPSTGRSARWLRRLMGALRREPVVVRVALAAVRGSAPREAGVSMLVGRTGIEGTIGGGRLEWDAITAARSLLEDAAGSALVMRVVLGADLGQCCGGVVDVWLERVTRAELGALEALERAACQGEATHVSTLTPAGVERRVLRGTRRPSPSTSGRVSRSAGGLVSFEEPLNDDLPPVWLYGAGHVGQALARIVAELPLSLTWIDARAAAFPSPVPDHVTALCAADPVASVSDAPVGTRFIVMTHSHPLDFGLCHAILQRNDFAWAGLIGSRSKSARFRSRLRRRGLAAEVIARLVCPVGIDGIGSKWPAAIAVGVAAQLLRDAGRIEEIDAVRPLAEAADLGCASVDCAACGASP